MNQASLFDVGLGAAPATNPAVVHGAGRVQAGISYPTPPEAAGKQRIGRNEYTRAGIDRAAEATSQCRSAGVGHANGAALRPTSGGEQRGPQHASPIPRGPADAMKAGGRTQASPSPGEYPVGLAGNQVAAIMAAAPVDEFSEWFRGWLTSNWHIWEAFRREADRVWQRGRTHYSARTIVEVLRHESALRETGDGWKINDWATPFMAKLYVRVHPDRRLFEVRS